MNAHDCGPDLTMAPWSIGKYAKRSATIHIGSEDLTAVDSTTGKLFPTTADSTLLNVFDPDVLATRAGGAAYSTAALGGPLFITGTAPPAHDNQFWLGVGGDLVSDYTNGVALTTANIRQIDGETNFLTCVRAPIRADTQAIMAVNDEIEIQPVGAVALAANGDQKRIRLVAPYVDVVGGYAGQRTLAGAMASMTGQIQASSQYNVVRAGGDAVDSLATATVIPLESDDGTYNGVVKADFGDGNIVDVVKGDII